MSASPRTLRMGRWRRSAASIFGINRRNIDLVYAHNERRDYPLADDKIRCKALLSEVGVPVPPTVAVCRGLFEVAPVVKRLSSRGDFVVKPANGSGGDGIMVTGALQADGHWRSPSGEEITPLDLRQQLANITFGAFSKQLEDQALVEARVVPHVFYRELWANGVCDLRILVLRGRPFMAMVRVPTLTSGGKANLHQGGIGVAVRLATGVTYAASLQGNPIDEHPETGVPLTSRTVPLWTQCLEVARAAAAAFPLGYLGVDLVVDDVRGPLVLEVNVRPGLEIQNVCKVSIGDALAREQAQ